ncbi:MULTISPECIES: carbohydrate ABC transporter permease [Bacillus]|uniref:ABC transporter permease n=2 Tax=Bacillus TaxID=1386 RepID=A0A0M4FUT1_9BACI|nr:MULTISPECIES: sugar ABC transporter permease [Bacillus]ALC84073.1 ABC transporter permease [Bacillus gobiensis]MBP1079546.1 multiple sugar transport system permease protein [Bacillus capparidis]MED1094947.1 sugar ABC transporter permease [Bacillus capparidis]
MATKVKVSREKKAERRLAYLLIIPSVVLILVVAIWPVIQSFYFSLFDYRLNDPKASTLQYEHQLDLSVYLDTQPFLVAALDEVKEIPANEQGKLDEAVNVLTSLDEDVREYSDERYDEINTKLMEFETPSSEEKMVSLNEQEAENYTEKSKQASELITGIAALEKDEKITGLAKRMDDAVVEPNFIGLAHYGNLFSNMRLWNSLYNTLFFTVISVCIELIIGLAIALLIHKSFFGRGMVRASILIPWAIPTAVSALMWKFLYDGQNGIIAKYLSDIGLFESMGDLLTSGAGAMFSIIFTDVWKTTPYMALLLLAGLQTIPNSLYEAASIDGAGKWKRFVTITLPLLKSSILVALLFRTLDAFRVFDLIYVLTGGGPANSTEVISLYAYKIMFSQTNFGQGSAISVIVFLCVAVISVIYIKLLGSDLISDKK